MKKFIDIVINEYKNIFTDAGALLILVVGVFMYSIFYSIPYSNEVLKDVPIGVIDFDNTEISREFIRNIDANENTMIASRPKDVNQAKEEFFSGKIKSFLIIPKDFQHDLQRGGQATVSLYNDSSYLLVYKQVSMGVISVAQTLGAKAEVNKLMKQGMNKNQAMSVVQPFEFIQMPLFNPSGGYASYIYPIVLILILQQTLLVGMGLVAGTIREKKKNYCELHPSLPFVIFAKSTAYVGLYTFYSIFYFLIFPTVINYNMHYNIMALPLLLIPYLYSICFLALTMVYFFKERESAILVLVVTSLPMIFLPGFIWPKETIPAWLNILSNFIPATSAIDGLIRVNQMGATIWQVKHDIFILISLCVFYFITANFVIKKVCK